MRDPIDRTDPVTGPAQAADLRQHLAAAYGDFGRPHDAATVLDDIAAMLRRGSVQVTHPAYFGLFNPSVLPEAADAAALVAAFNPQTAAWTHSPAAYEMEQHALRFLASRIGYDPAAVGAHFCSGGQEANTTAVVVAVTRAFPDVRDGGLRALPARPVVYVSAEAHHSFEKAAHVAGLGRTAVRRIPVDDRFRMRMDELRMAVRWDAAGGREHPALVVGTAGTTSSGAIDPLPEIADLCARHGVWFHCDAAWGGGALLSPSLRGHLAGIERADSVTWDAHKWLQTPLGGGMFFTPHAGALVDAFATQRGRCPPAGGEHAARAQAPTQEPRRAVRGSDEIGEGVGYMPAARGGVVDPFNASHQWSRRAAGLPVFAALATRGAAGYAAIVDRMTAMGDLLRAKLRAAGWDVVNDTPLPLVVFTHPRIESGETTAGDVARAVVRSGRAWISPVVLPPTPSRPAPRRALRACITSHRTEPQDLDALLAALANE